MAPAAGGQQGIEGTGGGTELADAGNVEDVGDDGGGGGAGAGAGTEEHHLPHRVAFHQDGVIDPIDTGQGVAARQQGGVDAHIQGHVVAGRDGGWGRVGAGAGLEALGHGQQLDDVAQLVGVGHIPRFQPINAFGGDGGALDAAPIGKTGQDGDLVGGVAPLDIGGGVGFGVTQPLGIGQNIGVGGPLSGHAAEDVVGGAVDDAADPQDAVAPQRLLQRFDDRDAAAHRRLNQHINAPCGGGGGDFFAVAGDHRLVGRDHRFTGGDGLQDQAAGRLQPPHHLDNNVDGGIVHYQVRVGHQQGGIEADGPGPARIAHRHAAQGQLAHQGMAPFRAGKDGGHPRAHRAKTKQADANRHGPPCHKHPILEIHASAGAAKRTAWACMARRMLRKPLAREGVRLACSPVAARIAGSRAAACWGVRPSRPSISRASRPLVMAASESPRQCRVPSWSVPTTYTWETQPLTL